MVKSLLKVVEKIISMRYASLVALVIMAFADSNDI